ncbi:hypothetical protein LINPERPRIM_LOCUS25359, partial [Linum perenne]
SWDTCPGFLLIFLLFLFVGFCVAASLRSVHLHPQHRPSPSRNSSSYSTPLRAIRVHPLHRPSHSR